MNLRLSLITSCYNLIINDPGVNSLLPGGVALELDQAQDQQPFPYMVHTLSIKEEGWPICTAKYAISCWSKGFKADLSLNLAQAIKDIFQWRSLSTDEAKVARFFFVDDPAMPTGDKEVWRSDVIFDIRFYDQKTALAVINR